MEQIRKTIKNRDDFNRFLEILMDRIKSNEPISDNGMLDGMIIGFIFSNTKVAQDLFLSKEMGNLLDGTIQKLEQIVIWVVNNETILCDILNKHYEKSNG